MPGVDPRRLARALALGRLAIGATLVVAPRRAGRPLAGAEAGNAGAQLLLRALGIRDAALGAGLWLALAGDGDAGTWLALGALSDAVDGVAAIAGARRLPPSTVALVGIGGPAGAVSGWWARSRLSSSGR